MLENKTEQEKDKNLNWVVLSIPGNCKSILVCADGELFDKRVKHGVIPLLDDRNEPSEKRVPCFIGYAPISDQKHLDILAGLHEAKQDEAPTTDHHDHAGVQAPSQELDNGQG